MAGDEAHAEMMRAVARRECLILSRVTTPAGYDVQWSAWRFHTGQMHVQAWHRPPCGHWNRGPSFTIESESLMELLALSQGYAARSGTSTAVR